MAYFESLHNAQIPFCSFCKLEKITEWKCVDCDKLICYECKIIHLWKNDMNEHNIVCTKSAFTERLSDKPELAKTCCSEHNEFNHTNYCLYCKQLVCPECMASGSTHFKHENITIVKCRDKGLEELEHLKTKIENEIFLKTEDKMKSLTNLDIAFEEKYQNEKKKIENQIETLKNQITQCSHTLIACLENDLKKNKDIIEKGKSQLLKIQKELKNEIKNIKSIIMKNNVEEILYEAANISSRVQQNSYTPVSFPQVSRMFCPKTNDTTDITTIIGYLENYNIVSELKGRINYYNLIYGINSSNSLAIARNGTIYIADDKCVSIELKPNKKPKMLRIRYEILDITTSDLSQLLFISRGYNHVMIKSDTNKTKAFYTLRNGNNLALALCACRDGRVLVLYAKDVPSSIFKSECSIKVKIDMVSNNGIFMKEIKCDFHSKWNISTYSRNRFRIRENINDHICILCTNQGEVIDLNQDEKVAWTYPTDLGIDIETTSVGNIIVAEKFSDALKVLSSDGKPVYLLDFEFNIFSIYDNDLRICSKNCREIVIISHTKMLIIEHFLPI